MQNVKCKMSSFRLRLRRIHLFPEVDGFETPFLTEGETHSPYPLSEPTKSSGERMSGAQTQERVNNKADD